MREGSEISIPVFLKIFQEPLKTAKEIGKPATEMINYRTITPDTPTKVLEIKVKEELSENIFIHRKIRKTVAEKKEQKRKP